MTEFDKFLKDPEGVLRALDAFDAAGSLSNFIRLGWHILEPSTVYVHGWVIDAIAEHLEAVTLGDITRLLINVPPGTLKSLSTSVFWPAWEWGPLNLPSMRYLTSSYSEDYAIRDAKRMRDLVASDWYQEIWGDRVHLTKLGESKFENSAMGWRQGVPFSRLTGGRADRVICFPSWETVQTENGPMAIGEIVDSRLPIRVWSANTNTGEVTLKPVIGWVKNSPSDLVEIGLSDRSRVTCTPNHRVWTERGWVRAELLRTRDRLPFYQRDGADYRTPLFVRRVGHADATYCLTVDGNHTFYVGDGNPILVANCDDPHSTEMAESEAERLRTRRIFLESVPTRLNNPEKSAIVVIMQRLHEEDVSGVILSKELGYEHLMLPMEFDPSRKCYTSIGFEDPRTIDGELLFPERFPKSVVERDKAVMGSYAAAGQFAQSPEPRGGGIFKRDWWQDWTEANYPEIEYCIASLDTAYTEKQENDPSAMTVWGIFYENIKGYPHPRAILMHAWQDRLQLHELVAKTIQSCRRWKVSRLLIENKASGISVAQEIRRIFARETWSVQLVDPKGQDKVARAYAVTPLFEQGLIYAPVKLMEDGEIVDRDWVDMVKHQAATFPKAAHDDLVDCMTQAINHFRLTGMLQIDAEVEEERDDLMAYKKSSRPLYGAV